MSNMTTNQGYNNGCHNPVYGAHEDVGACSTLQNTGDPSAASRTDGVLLLPGHSRREMRWDRPTVYGSGCFYRIVFLVWDTVLAPASETRAQSFLSFPASQRQP